MNHTLFITLLLMLQSSNAETFYLKTGEKLVGTSKKLDSKTIEIVSGKKGIRLYKTVKKSDIIKITREDIELKLFTEIEALESTPDLMPTEWYTEQLSKIETFKDEFPASDKHSKVRSVERALKKESAVIKEGGVKVNGEVVSAKEKVARSYDINAIIEAGKFHQLYEERKLEQAINIVDKLETEYYHSKAFSEIYVQLPEFLKKYRSSLNFKKQIFKEQDMKHNERLKMLTSTELKKYKKSREMKEMAFEKRSMMGMQNGNRWQSVNPFEMNTIDDLQRDVENYRTEVEAKLVSYQPQNEGETFSKAWISIGAGELTSADTLIKQLADLNFNSLYLGQLEEYYEEARDRQRVFNRIEKRGYEVIPEDLYTNVDTSVLDSIIEVIGAVNSLEKLNGQRSVSKTEKLVQVRQAKVTISVKTSRIERLLNYRESLEGLEEESLEKLDTEFQKKKAIFLSTFEQDFSKIEKDFKEIMQSEVDAFKKSLL